MFCAALVVMCVTADPKPDEETLLAKGDGYCVHSVRQGLAARGAFDESMRGKTLDKSSGYVITHVNTATGKMTRLAAGGMAALPSAALTGAMSSTSTSGA